MRRGSLGLRAGASGATHGYVTALIMLGRALIGSGNSSFSFSCLTPCDPSENDLISSCWKTIHILYPSCQLVSEWDLQVLIPDMGGKICLRTPGENDLFLRKIPLQISVPGLSLICGVCVCMVCVYVCESVCVCSM